MARPKKDPKDLRNKKAYYYMTKDEEDALLQALTIVNEEKSDFIRKAIQERINRIRKDSKQS